MRDALFSAPAFGSEPWRDKARRTAILAMDGLATLGRSRAEAKAETIWAARLAFLPDLDAPDLLPAGMPFLTKGGGWIEYDPTTDTGGISLAGLFKALVGVEGLNDDAGRVDDLVAESVMDVVQKTLDAEFPWA